MVCYQQVSSRFIGTSSVLLQGQIQGAAKQPPSLQLINLDLTTKYSYTPVCEVKKSVSIDISGYLSTISHSCGHDFTNVGVAKVFRTHFMRDCLLYDSPT